MRFNATGDLTGGLGMMDLWVWPQSDQSPRPLGASGGQGQWLTDDLLIAFDHHAQRVGLWRKSHGYSRQPDLWLNDGNALGAGNGNWLMTRIAGEIETVGEAWDVTVSISDRLIAVAPDGAYVVLRPDDSYRVQWGPDKTLVLPPSLAFVTMRDGYVMAKDTQTQRLRVWNEAGPVAIQLVEGPSWPGIPFVYGGDLWLWYETGTGQNVIHRAADASRGHFMGLMYGRDVWVRPDGAVDLAWATGQGEAVGFLHRETKRIAEGMVALTAAPSTPVSPPAAPTPRPGFSALPAWPRKLWLGAWKPGTTDPIGNVLVVDHGDVARIAALGLTDWQGAVMPLIVNADDPEATSALNLTIAWQVHSPTLDHLARNVREALETLPEKPVLAYLDQRGWPDERPDWLTDRVWPNVQCYRGVGRTRDEITRETVEEFEARVGEDIRRVAGYGRPFFLTAQGYDRNGWTSDAHACSTYPVIERWTRKYDVVGLLPFADRRQGGLQDLPEAHAWWHAAARAVPERPGRYDYWQSADRTRSWTHRLSQHVSMLAVTAAERAELLAAVSR